MKGYIDALVAYAVNNGLIHPDDTGYIFNSLLDVLGLDAPGECAAPENAPLADILAALTDDAVRRGVTEDDITSRDLFDTRLMGVLTPRPHAVRAEFAARYAESPQCATEWYYKFSGDTNYIRRDRIAKDVQWRYPCEYGELDITINLSKPEKDPRAIAAARNAPQSGYPLCQLCEENEGYAGRINHPARQNHRLIPVTLRGESWYLQYSPYVYYNEHCIVLNSAHTPMKVERASFDRLFDFVRQFPHYFVGSNADLPIVGGSILSHDHFQGGNYEFAMAKAPIEREIAFKGYADVAAGIVKWPMSVVRLRGADSARVAELAEKLLKHWRGYTDAEAMIFAETDNTPHNTITPIARRRGAEYELDLVLRNNLTTDEFPLGVFHPHQELHHIKKENIGLIEVMGLAVLPSRLKTELELLKTALIDGADVRADARIAAHADWADKLKKQYTFTPDNTEAILRQEVGRVFLRVLEDAGVYKCTDAGRAAFMRFVDAANRAL